MQVWLNGAYLNAQDAVIPATDRGFLLGDGFFETMRAHRGTVAWLHAHMERLAAHAAVIGLSSQMLPSGDDIAEIIATLCQGNGLQSAVVRLSLSRGSGQRGLLPPENPTPTIMVTTAPFTPAPSSAGLTLITAQKIRRNPWSVAGTIKSLNYLDNIVAKQEAQQAGADDALIMSVDGSVAETTIANLFGIKDGALWTPDGTTGILCGLARSFVINCAKANGIETRFDPRTPLELSEMDMLFTANALRGMRPVMALDGAPIGNAKQSQDIFTMLTRMVEGNLCNGIIV